MILSLIFFVISGAIGVASVLYIAKTKKDNDNKLIEQRKKFDQDARFNEKILDMRNAINAGNFTHTGLTKAILLARLSEFSDSYRATETDLSDNIFDRHYFVSDFKRLKIEANLSCGTVYIKFYMIELFYEKEPENKES